jgi:hypothetical protein
MIRLQVKVERETDPQPPHGYRYHESIHDWLQIEIDGEFGEEFIRFHLERLDHNLNVDCWASPNKDIAIYACDELGVAARYKRDVFTAISKLFSDTFLEPQNEEKPC